MLDPDDAISTEEAAEAIRDMIAFGAESGSHLNADRARNQGNVIVLELMREHNFVKGRPQRFKITIEPIEEENSQ